MNARLHVAFTELGAEILREALVLHGKSDDVIACPDFWQCGVLEPAAREAWLREHLGADHARHQEAHAAFWSYPFAATKTVLWLTRRSAQEWTGCFEWLSRELSGDFQINDLTDICVNGRPAVLHMLEPDDIIAAGLLDRMNTPSPFDLEWARAHWRDLNRDNAPLRIVRNGELVSAWEDEADRALMAHLEKRWKSAAIIIGETLCDDLEAWTFNFTDSFLAERLDALHTAGVIITRPGQQAPMRRAGLYALDVRLK